MFTPHGTGSDRIFPTYRQIQIIEAIALHGTIGQAADALHLSQPAVTRALKNVEDLLGVRLFDRTPNGVIPTVFIEPILKRTQSLRIQMQETERDLARMRNADDKTLNIGAGIHSIDIWCNKALASLVLYRNDLKISVVPYDWNELLVVLREGRIDYGIGEISELTEIEDLKVEHLAHLQLHFVCASHHPLTQFAHPNISDITRFPMVGNKMARGIASHFRHDVGKLGEYDYETGGILPAIRVASLNAIKHVLFESDAIALMPFESVRAEVVAGSLMALSRQAMPWLVGQIGFISAESRHETSLMALFRRTVLAIESQRTDSHHAENSLHGGIQTA